ncbi:TIGR04255 family protein [Candidatus Synechococcus calcipolaris G9]|uniref:TIGR04255 family protein n=1 Tax=Candidatus Synechococcus calcipolaris G9 TaxID=1497997 RepID=A0ABT6EX80_9SYNE|nr:TIGR04255 family protein [Candidatus Synechococcus calcipolaris]MDG2990094.1 TIGR04255 family protein [Candidatus Synechococcus calcipolaris G9]
MSPLPKFSLNLNEEFPALKAAPSIEAVIHWQAHAGKKLEPEALQAELTQRLPDYPILQPQQDIQLGAMATPDGFSEFFQQRQWSGFRLQDEQNRHVAQFTLNGVAFSRLEPYEDWDRFQTEALRFWHIFLELAEPTVIQRLGVRYINRIPLDDGEQPSHYLTTIPAPPSGVELTAESFFHQDTYPIPGYSYSINWVRTIQPAGADPTDGRALIVDIDVFTQELLKLDQDTLAQGLQEMRWLKNKVFFSCITSYALKRFGATS